MSTTSYGGNGEELREVVQIDLGWKATRNALGTFTASVLSRMAHDLWDLRRSSICTGAIQCFWIFLFILWPFAALYGEQPF
jgi:hypothetical protein